MVVYVAQPGLSTRVDFVAVTNIDIKEEEIKIELPGNFLRIRRR